MPETVLSYEDWRDFFKSKFIDAGFFALARSFSKEDTEIEIYTPVKGNLDTTIEIGYFSAMTLIYIHIFNPETPGKNRQQELEHLYKYEFDLENQYSSPGLDFTEINVQGISNYLDQGFSGSETIYYRNGKPVKSLLTTSYYPDSPQITMTYHFNADSVFKRLFNWIPGQEDKFDEIRTVKLQNIFAGLNGI